MHRGAGDCDLWSWPDANLSHPQRDAALRESCNAISRDLRRFCGGEAAHPLELGMRLHEAVACSTGFQPVSECGMGILPVSVVSSVSSLSQEQQRQKQRHGQDAHATHGQDGRATQNARVTPAPPVLARGMCASPFDAAVHDAVGIALGRSAFSFYDHACPLPTADACFEGGDACDRIARLLRKPKRDLNAWYIVGKNDTRETLAPWVRRGGYRHFKIKTLGKDSAQDVARTIKVYRMAESLGAGPVVLSVDANEGNPDAQSVLDYLQRLAADDAQAFAALQYLEQPTTREIALRPYDWRPVAALKPVLLDEGLTGPELMPEALRQGWSGLAVKTCKGHSFSLVAAAWAKEHGLLLACQDLTNPGLAMIHSALFAAHVPTINDVELNSPQFTPAANEPWLPRLAGLFQPTGGVHRLPPQTPVGLGSKM
jgi:L-alanine-DL-glutamate epimerase-like enolase superfamily enzyme